MSGVLEHWNRLSPQEAAQEILPCCGSSAWARELTARRPFSDVASMISASDKIWNSLTEQDWLEAFSKHPRIGERKATQAASARSAEWSKREQQNVALARDDVRSALAAANHEYEQRFGRVFLVCATGRSAAEMLDNLQRRMKNDDAAELREAAEEQRKITNLRLKKWLEA